MKLPESLSFLEDINVDPSERYRTADWLLSNFYDPVWEYSFGYESSRNFSWDVHLEDGSSLLSESNVDLLNGFKYWLIIATTPNAGQGSNDLKVQARDFRAVMRLVDYFLLNAGLYKLSKVGLGAINTDDLKSILTLISSGNESVFTLLKWEECLSRYLIGEVENTNSAVLDSVLAEHKFLSLITPEQEDNHNLPINLDLIPRIRAYLFINDFYYINGRPHTKKLSQLVYRNTILAKNISKPVPDILSYSRDIELVGRELQGVPVNRRNLNSKVTESQYRMYHRAIYNLGALHTLNISAPSIESLLAIRSYTPEISKLGRSLSLPSKIVFDAVEKAIEFHLEYGQALVDSYCRLVCKVLAAQRFGYKSKLTSLTTKDIHEAISPKIKEMGVSQLSLSLSSTSKKSITSIEGTDYFYQQLRKNKGFLELIGVYVGCVQLVVGAICARRQSELSDLKAGSCFDSTLSWLVFKNGKSTRSLMGLRKTEARPIEPIAVDMIKQLERMQKRLKRMGVINELGPLFSTPSLRGSLGLSFTTQRYNSNLNLFCDYFEVASDEQNRRYYIRQHMLRRFFAMLFFYSSSFGGLETLQWMLGHTDPEHVWHYITETMEGDVLRSAKAQFIAESIHHLGIEGNQNYRDLTELVKSRFGTEDVTLAETSELEEMITDLMIDGEIEIEPEFFEDQDGQQIQVMVKIIFPEVS